MSKGDWYADEFDERLIDEVVENISGEIDADDYVDVDTGEIDEDDLRSEIERIVSDSFWDIVPDIIDRETIYYSDCFQIVDKLQYVSGWLDDTEYGPYDGICSVAEAALMFHIQETTYEDDIVEKVFDKLVGE